MNHGKQEVLLEDSFRQNLIISLPQACAGARVSLEDVCSPQSPVLIAPKLGAGHLRGGSSALALEHGALHSSGVFAIFGHPFSLHLVLFTSPRSPSLLPAIGHDVPKP